MLDNQPNFRPVFTTMLTEFARTVNGRLIIARWGFFAAILLTVVRPAQAQTEYAPAFDPVIVITRSITAQGDVIRAQGEAYHNYQAGNLLYARARSVLADAVDKELDNYQKRVKVYWNNRLEREERRMELIDAYEKRKDKYLELREAARERLLKSILEDRERGLPAIESGLALNKLLDAFLNTPVSYGIELGPSLEMRLGEDLTLTRALLDGISVKSSGGGSKQVFRLTQSTGMDLSWWPDLMRRTEYAEHRQSIENALAVVHANSSRNGQVEPAHFDGLEQAIARLSQAFERAHPASARKGLPMDEFRQYLRADDFFLRLHRDLGRMRDTGSSLALGNADPFDMETDGKDVQSLIRWLLRNGVTFSESTPGNESHYQQLFSKMSNIYVAIAE